MIYLPSTIPTLKIAGDFNVPVEAIFKLESKYIGYCFVKKRSLISFPSKTLVQNYCLSQKKQ